MNSKYILIVDDDPDDREIFTYVIGNIDKSISIGEFGSSESVMENLGREDDKKPDMIFLDLNMPRVHGKDCLKMLKTLDSTKAIPVVIYSTSSNNKDIKDAMDLGAADFITKTSDLDDLRTRLKNILVVD